MVEKELEKLKNPEKAKTFLWFFKTGKGQYGEGDVFWGITVPEVRKVAKRNAECSIEEVESLLKSKVHEHRLAGLLILVEKYKSDKDFIYDFYLSHLDGVNNWDLVDLSSRFIVGDYLLNRDRAVLYELAKDENLWKRRIAIVSTYPFIKKNDFKDVFAISEILLKDDHDLIQKAVGWMLREAGKMDEKALVSFLEKHKGELKRTTLRYAIERFEEKKRKKFLLTH